MIFFSEDEGVGSTHSDHSRYTYTLPLSVCVCLSRFADDTRSSEVVLTLAPTRKLVKSEVMFKD